MSTPNRSLTKYLRENIEKQVSHFALCASINQMTGEVEFYIHPAHVSGETADFVTTEDPENDDFDFIYNKANGLSDDQIKASVRRLLASLKSKDIL